MHNLNAILLPLKSIVVSKLFWYICLTSQNVFLNSSYWLPIGHWLSKALPYLAAIEFMFSVCTVLSSLFAPLNLFPSVFTRAKSLRGVHKCCKLTLWFWHCWYYCWLLFGMFNIFLLEYFTDCSMLTVCPFTGGCHWILIKNSIDLWLINNVFPTFKACWKIYIFISNIKQALCKSVVYQLLIPTPVKE